MEKNALPTKKTYNNSKKLDQQFVRVVYYKSLVIQLSIRIKFVIFSSIQSKLLQFKNFTVGVNKYMSTLYFGFSRVQKIFRFFLLYLHNNIIKMTVSAGCTQICK